MRTTCASSKAFAVYSLDPDNSSSIGPSLKYSHLHCEIGYHVQILHITQLLFLGVTFNVGRQTPGGPSPLSKQPDKAFRSVFAASVDQTLLQGPEVEVEKIKILLVVVGW